VEPIHRPAGIRDPAGPRPWQPIPQKGVAMEQILGALPGLVDEIAAIKESIITNILLIGQIPSPTFKEKRRSAVFMERLAEANVDECTTDGYRNPIGIIRGSERAHPPIFMVAHLDTFFDREVDHNFTVKDRTISGPGILDNSAGAGVLASMPDILKHLGLTFKSDIVLAGVIQSLGKGNLRGIRHLMKNWPTAIRAAVVVEGGELGRLNYYSDGMIRCEVVCNIPSGSEWVHRFKPNAILILHEVINQILKLRLPQRPRSRVIIGKIQGGFKHGIIAYDAILGFEIHSDSDRMVKSIFNDIKDMVTGVGHEYEADLRLKTISNTAASRLRYNHPLVKSVGAVMKRLHITPVGEPSASELSILLSRRIPAVTLGLTRGERYHQKNAAMEIAPLPTGIAQVIGTLMAIDSGVCDDS
jgi:tripeptide aminopeptidase